MTDCTKMIERLRAEPWAILHDAADMMAAMKTENEELTYELQVIEENHFQLKKERDQLQSENERLKAEAETFKRSWLAFTEQMKDVAAERDQLQSKLDELGKGEPVAHRAWFDADNGARWLFTLWPEEEKLEVEWEPLYAAPKALAPLERVAECAARLVEHADFQLGGILSADSKAKDIPSKAVSQVKSRHLAALRDSLAAHGIGGTP